MMPRLTPQERAELEARLAEDDADDEDDRVKIGRADGSYFEGTYRRARRLGYVTEPASKDDGDSASSTDDAKTVKRFTAGRRTS
jgi:hypothetical protein